MLDGSVNCLLGREMHGSSHHIERSCDRGAIAHWLSMCTAMLPLNILRSNRVPAIYVIDYVVSLEEHLQSPPPRSLVLTIKRRKGLKFCACCNAERANESFMQSKNQSNIRISKLGIEIANLNSDTYEQAH